MGPDAGRGGEPGNKRQPLRANAEQRPQQAQRLPVDLERRLGPHARQTVDPGAAQEPQQHGLSLVVGGVAEQHAVGVLAPARLGQEALARRAAGRLARLQPGRPLAAERQPSAVACS